eukprot:617366-Heterocapsa_arctica.AAC.1
MCVSDARPVGGCRSECGKHTRLHIPTGDLLRVARLKHIFWSGVCVFIHILDFAEQNPELPRQHAHPGAPRRPRESSGGLEG